jgi:hypothetical protein
VASPYDEALAEALGDEEGDLGKRLLSGEADDDDRRQAREQLEPLALRRFELAHPIVPREKAIEVDAGEVEFTAGDLDAKAIRAHVEEALAEHDGREVVVRLAVRVTPSR